MTLEQLEIEIRQCLASKPVDPAIGSLLAQAKALCGHGQWIPWVTRVTGLTMRTVQRYLGKVSHIENATHSVQPNATLPNATVRKATPVNATVANATDETVELPPTREARLAMVISLFEQIPESDRFATVDRIVNSMTVAEYRQLVASPNPIEPPAPAPVEPASPRQMSIDLC